MNPTAHFSHCISQQVIGGSRLPRDGQCRGGEDDHDSGCLSHPAQRRTQSLVDTPQTFAKSTGVTPLIPLMTLGCRWALRMTDDHYLEERPREV